MNPNEVDGRFYGFLPPHDNPNIKKLGASSTDDYVDGIMIVYVQKQPNSINRRVVAFTDNARVGTVVKRIKLYNELIANVI